MNEWLQILLILFVVWWTARAARNKGHNMLIWATLSAIPAVGLVPGFPDGLTALCMFPMLALMFVPARRPVEAEEEEDTTVACPRCQHVHDPGPSFLHQLRVGACQGIRQRGWSCGPRGGNGYDATQRHRNGW